MEKLGICRVIYYFRSIKSLQRANEVTIKTCYFSYTSIVAYITVNSIGIKMIDTTGNWFISDGPNRKRLASQRRLLQGDVGYYTCFGSKFGKQTTIRAPRIPN